MKGDEGGGALFKLFIWGFFWGGYFILFFQKKRLFSFLFFSGKLATFSTMFDQRFRIHSSIHKTEKRKEIVLLIPCPPERNKTDTCTIAIAMMADVHGLPLPDETPEADYVRTDTTSFWDVYALARRILGGCVSTSEEVGWGIVGMFLLLLLLLLFRLFYSRKDRNGLGGGLYIAVRKRGNVKIKGYG